MVHADGGSFISETCMIRPENEDDGGPLPTLETRLCNCMTANVGRLEYHVDPYIMPTTYICSLLMLFSFI